MARQRAGQQAHTAFSRVGTANVAPVPNSDTEQETSRDHDAPTPRGHDAVTSRRHRAPVAAEAVALTVRLDQEEALELDQFMLTVRRDAGRRVDKAELMRALLRLARGRGDLRAALLDELDTQ